MQPQVPCISSSTPFSHSQQVLLEGLVGMVGMVGMVGLVVVVVVVVLVVGWWWLFSMVAVGQVGMAVAQVGLVVPTQ